MNINTIYVSYQGEQNLFGIGKPVIFIRTQGCHLRCYKATLDCLCDTPEALDTKIVVKEMSVDDIVNVCVKHRNDYGVSHVCLTGGDPLYGDDNDITHLLLALSHAQFHVSIETSGTISIRQYQEIPNISFVLDYKVKSAGLTAPFHKGNLELIGQYNTKPTGNIHLKFVLYDVDDYSEMVDFILREKPQCDMSAGLYWGTDKLSHDTLFRLLKGDSLLGKVSINMQTHKLATLYDKTIMGNIDYLKSIFIPTEL
jgi:organic radical activating enzyme